MSIRPAGSTDLKPVLDAIADLKGDVADLGTRMTRLEGEVRQHGTRMVRLEGEVRQHGILLRGIGHAILAEDVMATALSDRNLEEIVRKAAEDKRKEAREGRPREGPFSLGDLPP